MKRLHSLGLALAITLVGANVYAAKSRTKANLNAFTQLELEQLSVHVPFRHHLGDPVECKETTADKILGDRQYKNKQVIPTYWVQLSERNNVERGDIVLVHKHSHYVFGIVLGFEYSKEQTGKKIYHIQIDRVGCKGERCHAVREVGTDQIYKYDDATFKTATGKSCVSSAASLKADEAEEAQPAE